MKHSYLSKEISGIQVYEAPVCEVVYLGAQKVICASDTEVVGEEEGEW